MSSEPYAISCKDLGKTYQLFRRPSDRLWAFLWPNARNRSSAFHALEGISFNLRKGEVLGVVGLNGAGKSTLLQLITGTLSPTAGSVTTHGRVAAILELGSGFNPEFTGRENIFLNAATLGLSRIEIETRVDEIISFAGIEDFIDHPVKTYSSGMQIRLAFSIATSVDPDILIIDEALSVGDGAFSKKSFDRIMTIKEQGATILFCSHVLFHIDTFCDRALWLHRGQQRALGDVRNVLSQYQAFLDDQLTINEVVQERLPASTSLSHDRFESVDVSIDGETGAELHGVSGQSTLAIAMEFRSDPERPCPTVAVVISDERGRILGSSSSLSSGLSISRDASGRGRACFTLPRLRLNRGTYVVGAYLLCERGMHGYDMRDPAATLFVRYEGVEQGAWLLDGRWDHA
jgi:lipopolysaccharide transport system ATP-binding protein